MDSMEESGLSSVLQNPELIEKVKSLLGSDGRMSASQSPVSGEGLNALLSNPELIKKLPQMMKLLEPLTASAPPALPAPEASLTPGAERDRLLAALRPFLSKERQDMIESILKLSKLGDVLKHLS